MELDDLMTVQLLDEAFNRKVFYQSPELSWQLPEKTSLFMSSQWCDSELQTMKEDLNAIKSKLSDIDITQWHNHTQAMHRGGGILPFVRKNYKPELCTQAWCKFYEILGMFPSIVPELVALNSVHLCEAPGAFVTSLNHFMVSQGWSGFDDLMFNICLSLLT